MDSRGSERLPGNRPVSNPDVSARVPFFVSTGKSFNFSAGREGTFIAAGSNFNGPTERTFRPFSPGTPNQHRVFTPSVGGRTLSPSFGHRDFSPSIGGMRGESMGSFSLYGLT
jgi:hypothetical protein